MVKRAFSVLAVTAAAGIALTPVAASAATTPAALATSSTAASGGDPFTTVTFTVTSTGTLSMTAPDTVNLGTGAVGSTISGSLGSETVTDNRALDVAAWTVTASSTDWTTGIGGSTTETIPAGDVTYAPGTITHTGTLTTTGHTITLANAVTPPALDPTVVAGTAGIGNNTATFSPQISVAVPGAAVAGAYSGVLTQSVQ
jgi:hypothetical protein